MRLKQKKTVNSNILQTTLYTVQLISRTFVKLNYLEDQLHTTT